MLTVSEDLLHDVLSLLPIDDLLRFRCVSKSWRALIDSPYFIQLHLDKSLKDIKSRKVLVYNWKYIFYALSVDSELKFSVAREIKPPVQNFTKLVCLGSCRSLICLKFTPRGYDEHKIVVWNPSKGSHRILPFTPVEIEGSKSQSYDFRYALGYDEVEDDYRVVRLTFNHVKYENDYEAKVYSLKLDTWIEIEKVPLHFSTMSSPILANGVIIWLLDARGWGETACSLLVLPLRTQALQLVWFPEGLNKLEFTFKRCSFCWYQIYSCGSRDCDSEFRNLLKLINNKMSDSLTELLLPDCNIYEEIDCLKDSLHEKLCSELHSLRVNLGSKSLYLFSEYTCCWVDSLVRVDRINNK